MKLYLKDIEINKNNIDEVMEKIENRPSNIQKKIIIGLSGGRNPITQEKMIDKYGNISATKLKNIPVVISSDSTGLAKKYTKKQLIEMQKQIIIKYNLFTRERKDEEK